MCIDYTSLTSWAINLRLHMFVTMLSVSSCRGIAPSVITGEITQEKSVTLGGFFGGFEKASFRGIPK